MKKDQNTPILVEENKQLKKIVLKMSTKKDDQVEQLTEKLKKCTNNAQYFYILQEREFIYMNENVYKIGKTCQEPNKRFACYPKNSMIYLLLKVDDCAYFENKIKDLFDQKFTQMNIIGREYYKGEIGGMIENVMNLYLTELSIVKHLGTKSRSMYQPLKNNDFDKEECQWFVDECLIKNDQNTLHFSKICNVFRQWARDFIGPRIGIRDTLKIYLIAILGNESFSEHNGQIQLIGYDLNKSYFNDSIKSQSYIVSNL